MYRLFLKKTGVGRILPRKKQYWIAVGIVGILYWGLSRSVSRIGVNPKGGAVERFGSVSLGPVIPLDIYQTWETSDLPEKMRECVHQLKQKNPRFKHHLFDNQQRRAFIYQHFEADVVDAYDRIVPGAYRADLWRYCVLYIHGGIYLDIKYSNVGDFDLISLTDREYFCRDIEASGGGIYNAFLICRPKNEKMWKCIRQIVRNVQTRYYGDSCLFPTGPMMMKQQFTDAELAEVSRNGLALCEDKCPTKTCICKDGEPILAIYKEYYEKEVSETPEKRYTELWDERAIYRN